MARASVPDRTADCSVVDAYLGGATLAVRTYEAPPPTSPGSPRAREQAPYVAAVAHCGQIYILQVKSRSQGAWVIQRARLEGPHGEVLQVNALRSDHRKDGWSLNVIVAETRPGAEVSKLKLHLTGEDGRVAQPEARDLP